MKAIVRDTRGAAMVEGVIVLPVFVLLLASVIYFHKAYATKIEVNRKARSCAWSYAISGCNSDSLPKGCPVGEIGGSDSIGNVFQPTLAAEDHESIVKKTSDLDSALEGGNALGLALVGLGEGIVMSPSKSFSRPSILSGGTKVISGNYSVMCNEKKQDLTTIAKAAYCAISKSLPGCKK